MSELLSSKKLWSWLKLADDCGSTWVKFLVGVSYALKNTDIKYAFVVEAIVKVQH